MKPRLTFSAGTGRVYVVTRYRVSVGPEGEEVLEAIGDSRFDVTDDFELVSKERMAALFPTTWLKRLSRPR
jgi:hypothetical protein